MASTRPHTIVSASLSLPYHCIGAVVKVVGRRVVEGRGVVQGDEGRGVVEQRAGVIPERGGAQGRGGEGGTRE